MRSKTLKANLGVIGLAFFFFCSLISKCMFLLFKLAIFMSNCPLTTLLSVFCSSKELSPQAPTHGNVGSFLYYASILEKEKKTKNRSKSQIAKYGKKKKSCLYGGANNGMAIVNSTHSVQSHRHFQSLQLT